jgi:hypothetical protein
MGESCKRIARAVRHPERVSDAPNRSPGRGLKKNHLLRKSLIYLVNVKRFADGVATPMFGCESFCVGSGGVVLQPRNRPRREAIGRCSASDSKLQESCRREKKLACPARL